MLTSHLDLLETYRLTQRKCHTESHIRSQNLLLPSYLGSILRKLKNGH